MTTIRLRTSSRDRVAQDLMNLGHAVDMIVADGPYSHLTTTAGEEVVKGVIAVAGVTCTLVHRV